MADHPTVFRPNSGVWLIREGTGIAISITLIIGWWALLMQLWECMLLSGPQGDKSFECDTIV
jgi:hypothetical protein